jgi:hypothetical protein
MRPRFGCCRAAPSGTSDVWSIRRSGGERGDECDTHRDPDEGEPAGKQASGAKRHGAHGDGEQSEADPGCVGLEDVGDVEQRGRERFGQLAVTGPQRSRQVDRLRADPGRESEEDPAIRDVGEKPLLRELDEDTPKPARGTNTTMEMRLRSPPTTILVERSP